MLRIQDVAFLRREGATQQNSFFRYEFASTKKYFSVFLQNAVTGYMAPDNPRKSYIASTLEYIEHNLILLVPYRKSNYHLMSSQFD